MGGSAGLLRRKAAVGGRSGAGTQRRTTGMAVSDEPQGRRCCIFSMASTWFPVGERQRHEREREKGET